MAKVIMLKIREANTIVKYLNLIDQEIIDKANKKHLDIHYSLDEKVKIKNNIFSC